MYEDISLRVIVYHRNKEGRGRELKMRKIEKSFIYFEIEII